MGSFSMNRSMSIRSVSLEGSELDVSGLEAERRYLNDNTCKYHCKQALSVRVVAALPFYQTKHKATSSW